MGKILCSMCLNSFDDAENVGSGEAPVCPNCGNMAEKKKDREPQAAVSAPMSISRTVQYQVKTSVKTLTFGGDGKEAFGGKGTLTVTEEGMQLKVKGLLSAEAELFIRWQDVRKLKNKLLQKKWFSADFGKGNDLVLQVNIKEGDVDWLSNVFDKLPDEAHGEICPACSGIAIRGICRECGKSISWEQRKFGLWMIIIGGAILAVGFGATFLFYTISEDGRIHRGGIGIIAIGGLIFSVGAFKLIFGKMDIA